MDKTSKAKKLLLMGSFLVFLLPFLSACTSSTSSSHSSTKSSTSAPKVRERPEPTPSSSQLVHTTPPTQEDLLIEVWYAKGSCNFVTFDETMMTLRAEHSIGSQGFAPHFYPYTMIDASTIKIDYGMTGVDDTYTLTWERNKIKLTPNDNQPNKEERSKILTSINDLIQAKNF